MSTVGDVKRKLNPVDDFEEIYCANFDFVRKKIGVLCKDYSLAEELTQEAFKKAWEARHTYQDQGYTVGAWIGKIAFNLWISHQRKAFRAVFSLDEVDEDVFDRTENYPSKYDQFSDPRDELKLAEANINWDWLMSKLASSKAYVMNQRFREGKLLQEIAHEIGIPWTTAGSRIRDAIDTLIPYLQEMYEDEFNIRVRTPSGNQRGRAVLERRLNGYKHLDAQRNKVSVLQATQTQDV